MGRWLRTGLHLDAIGAGLSLDADQGPQTRNSSGELGVLGCSNDRIGVFIGTGRLLGDTARGRRADQNSLQGEIIDDLAPAPLPERGMAGHRAAGSVTCRREGPLLAAASPTRMYDPVPMLPPISTGCPTGRSVSGSVS